MFLIVDNTRRKFRNEVRFKFNEMSIPCIITDLNHCNDYMPAALIIVTEKYLMEDVQFLAKMYDDAPVVLWDESVDMCKFAFDTYERIYGDRIFDSSKGRLLLEKDEIYLGGRRMYFTKTETKIFYLLYYSPGWQDKEHIAKYCLENGEKDIGAVPVHICNINNKAIRRANARIIKFKRFEGYCI